VALVFLMLIVEYARSCSSDCPDAGALTSARERSDGRSTRRGYSHAFRSVHMSAMTNGASTLCAGTLPGASPRGVIGVRVVYYRRGAGVPHEHPSSERESE